MNTKDKGDVTEAVSVSYLKKEGYTVSLPFGDNAPYDLIYDDGSSLTRVQCKTGQYKEGRVKFSCSTNHRSGGEIVHDTYTKDMIDTFFVYCRDTDNLYEVPVEDTPSREMSLRVDPVENENSRINWAEDYILQ